MKATGIAGSVSLVAGIIVGLVICVFLFRYMNKDKRVITKYDERQEVTRGKAYKYAFWSSMAAAAVVMVMDIAGISFASSFTKYFFIMFVGIIVHISYSIWNDAYIGINTNKKRLMIICVVAGAANLITVIGTIMGGQFIVNGEISDSGANLMCVIILFLAGIELFIKDRHDRTGAYSEKADNCL